MSVGEDPPSEKESPRQRTEGSKEAFQPINTSLPLGKQAGPPCKDIRLARYLAYTRALNAQAGGSPTSEFYLDVAFRLHGEFCRTCNGLHRRCSWSAIQTAVAWLT
jgi:hypothetical protein